MIIPAGGILADHTTLFVRNGTQREISKPFE